MATRAGASSAGVPGKIADALNEVIARSAELARRTSTGCWTSSGHG